MDGMFYFCMVVSTPVVRTEVCDSFDPNCKIHIGDYVLIARLIVLEMFGFDVILGMDWL